MDKAKVYQALLDTLTAEREALIRTLQAARDEATHGESRPENEYDTRALEASYLAAGQGERLESLDQLLGWARQQHPSEMELVDLGALVHLESEEGSRRWVLIAPEGGSRLAVDGQRVDVISGSSPLGKELAGLEEGDGVNVERPSGAMEWEILAVR